MEDRKARTAWFNDMVDEIEQPESAVDVEQRAEMLISLGRWADAHEQLRPHVDRYPLREQPRSLLMRSLAGDGRLPEALDAYHEYWLLLDARGRAPSSELRALASQIAVGWDGDPPALGRRPASDDPADEHGRHRFVGRGGELDAVAAAWARVSAGESAGVTIAGEPGVGKTALVEEWIKSGSLSAGSIVVRLSGDPQGETPFAQVVAKCLNQLPASALVTTVGQHGRALASLAECSTAAGEPSDQTVAAVLALLRAASENAALVIVLDDVRAGDGHARIFVERISEACLPRVLLVVVDGEARDATISLEPFDEAEVRDYVAAALGTTLFAGHPHIATELHRVTSGNPLHLHELLVHAADAGMITARAGGWDLAPDAEQSWDHSVAQIVRERMAELPALAVRVVEVAAAVGRDVFDVAGVAASAGLSSSATREALDAGRAARLVEPGEDRSWRFRHAVIGAAVYEGLSVERRAELERAASAVDDYTFRLFKR